MRKNIILTILLIFFFGSCHHKSKFDKIVYNELEISIQQMKNIVDGQSLYLKKHFFINKKLTGKYYESSIRIVEKCDSVITELETIKGGLFKESADTLAALKKHSKLRVKDLTNEIDSLKKVFNKEIPDNSVFLEIGKTLDNKEISSEKLSLITISKLQLDILNSEYLALNYLLLKVQQRRFSPFQPEIIVTSEKTLLKKGEYYEADIILVGYDSLLWQQISVEIEGKTIHVPVLNGKGLFTYKPEKHPGKIEYEVKVDIKSPDDLIKEYREKESFYFVK